MEITMIKELDNCHRVFIEFDKCVVFVWTKTFSIPFYIESDIKIDVIVNCSTFSNPTTY